MAKSPRETIKIRRLDPVADLEEGDEVYIKVRINKLQKPEGAGRGRVTIRVPGSAAPETLNALDFTAFAPDAD